MNETITTITSVITEANNTENQAAIRSLSINNDTLEKFIAIIIAAAAGLLVVSLIHSKRYPGGAIPISQLSAAVGIALGIVTFGGLHYLTDGAFGRHNSIVVALSMFGIVTLINIFLLKIKTNKTSNDKQTK